MGGIRPSVTCAGMEIAALVLGAMWLSIPAMAGVGVEIVADSSPENIVKRANCDFEDGLRGWTIRHSNEVCCVESEGHGKALYCSASTGRGAMISHYVTVNPDWKGRTFILSCDIKPSKDVTSRALPDSASGLGCKLTVWDAGWKKSASFGCMAEGPDRWFRVSSKPFALPDWTAHMSIAAGLGYSKGSGLVDNIELVEAGDGVDVSVKSDDAPIRQVKVFDERGGTVFDSGIIDGGKSWSRRILVGSALRLKVYAVDASGNVATSERDDVTRKNKRKEMLK